MVGGWPDFARAGSGAAGCRTAAVVLSRAMGVERVRVEFAGHVAMVTLMRGDKHNALDGPMLDALAAAGDRLRAEPGVRAVVLHGDGPSFCSGLDLPSVVSSEGGLAGVVDRLAADVPNWFQRAAYAWMRVPVPVIAAVCGHCLGGGLQIALAADIRIAAPDARLGLIEIKWGLVPDMAITRTLPQLVGPDVAKQLTWTGRVLSGTEAHALGLVTELAGDPLARARELADLIAVRSPDAIRAAKRLYDEGWSALPEVTLTLEAELQAALVGSPNQVAATIEGMGGDAAEFVDGA